MDEEKMAILKMLEEGKITSEEALLLLEALEGEQKQNRSSNAGKIKFEKADINGDEEGNEDERDDENDEENTIKDKVNDEIKKWKNMDNDFEEKMEQLSRLGEEIGEKMGKLGEELGERIGNLGESIGEKAASLAERFVEKFFNNPMGKPAGHELSVTKTWNNIPDGLNLEVDGINGKIELYTYDGTEMKVELKWGIKSNAKADVRVEPNGDSLPGIKVGNRLDSLEKPYFSIGYDATVVKYLSVVIWLPDKDYNQINLNTSNGKICVTKLTCKNLDAKSSNGKIEVLNTASDEVRCITSNAKVLLESLHAPYIFVKTSNGKIECINSELGDISFTTSNGGITVDNLRVIENQSRKIELITSNGSINVSLNEVDGMAYDITLTTSNGHGTIHLKDINYSGKNNFRYKSENYGVAPVNVSLKALTSNGSINVYKED